MNFFIPRILPFFLTTLAHVAASNANEHNLRGHNKVTRRLQDDIDMISEGQPVACDGDMTHIFRWTNGQLRNYPHPTVASSWDKNWRYFLMLDCINLGLPIGPDMTEIMDGMHYAGDESALSRSVNEAPPPAPSPFNITMSSVGKDPSLLKVEGSGYQIMRLKDAPSGSAEAFGLGPDASVDLHNALAKAILDEPPATENAFIGAGDDLELYETWSQFEQVNVIMEVIQTEVVGITSTPVQVGTKRYENDLDAPMTITAEVSDSVTQSATSTWSEAHTVAFSEEIGVSIGFEGLGGASVKDTLSFSDTFSSSNSVTKTVTVSTSLGVSFEIPPKGSAKVDLMARYCTLNVEVTYKQSLTGCIAMYYPGQYNGHWNWCYWADHVSNLSRNTTEAVVIFKHLIDVDFYSDTFIVASNANNGQVLASTPV